MTRQEAAKINHARWYSMRRALELCVWCTRPPHFVDQMRLQWRPGKAAPGKCRCPRCSFNHAEKTPGSAWGGEVLKELLLATDMENTSYKEVGAMFGTSARRVARFAQRAGIRAPGSRCKRPGDVPHIKELLERDISYRYRRQLEYTAVGKCGYCKGGKIEVPGASMCLKCLGKRRERWAAKYGVKRRLPWKNKATKYVIISTMQRANPTPEDWPQISEYLTKTFGVPQWTLNRWRCKVGIKFPKNPRQRQALNVQDQAPAQTNIRPT